MVGLVILELMSQSATLVSLSSCGGMFILSSASVSDACAGPSWLDSPFLKGSTGFLAVEGFKSSASEDSAPPLEKEESDPPLSWPTASFNLCISCRNSSCVNNTSALEISIPSHHNFSGNEKVIGTSSLMVERSLLNSASSFPFSNNSIVRGLTPSFKSLDRKS